MGKKKDPQGDESPGASWLVGSGCLKRQPTRAPYEVLISTADSGRKIPCPIAYFERTSVP
jgi:hypothetical protein